MPNLTAQSNKVKGSHMKAIQFSQFGDRDVLSQTAEAHRLLEERQVVLDPHT
jgi:methylaspartate ammonia-lyase